MPLRLADLAIAPAPLPPDLTLGEALARFGGADGLTALAVVEQGRPVGLLTRERLLGALAGALAPDLPVRRAMLSAFAAFACDMTVGLAARTLGETGGEALRHGIVLIRDGRYAGFVASHALLAAIAQENATRARAMRVLSSKLSAAREAAEAADLSARETLAVVGHELRTPLMGIVGVAELLARRSLPGDGRRLARSIQRSGILMNQLLGDLLDLTRLDAGTASLQPAALSLRALAGELRDLWTPAATERGLSLAVELAADATDRIETDPVRLRQIVFNLVTNALKFTTDGAVRVALATVTLEEALVLRITVTDTGPGIPEPERAHIFTRHGQGAAGRDAGGAGLGLYIVRGLAERMSGSVTLRNNTPRGSVFEVSLPVRRAGPRLAAGGGEGLRPRAFALGPVLLVEDHDLSREIITETLRSAGWPVDGVQTLDEARRRAGERAYQAVLCDLHLPDGDGRALAGELRSVPGPNMQSVLLAVTADVREACRNACLDSGFDGVVTKPVGPANLVAALADAILARHQPNDAAISA